MIKIVYSFFITFSIFLSFFCFELLAMETAKEDKSKISSTRKRKREELPPGQQQITSFFSKALPSSSLPQPRALIAHSSHLTYPPSIPALPIGGDTRASPFVAKAVHPPSFSDELSSSSSRTASLLPTVSDDKTNRGTEKITFLRGTDDHIRVFADLINSARERIILASWKLGFIPEDIFQALMKAKRNGVSLSFIVNSIQRKETLEPFTDEYDDDFEDSSFVIAETRSHAKFLFVDSQKLVLGSFNALGDSPEESEDASFLIEGSIQQMWPYFMRIRDIYTELDEEETVDSIFGCIAAISSVRYGNRNRFHLQRTLSCGTRIHLLKTVHFFRDTQGEDLQLHFVKDRAQNEVDFLITKSRKPWVLIECKLKPQGIPKPLRYFSKMLGVKKSFCVSFENCTMKPEISAGTEFTEIPAAQFLSKLV